MLMHLRCFFLLKIVKIYALLVCKIFCLKIRSCKLFDKYQISTAFLRQQKIDLFSLWEEMESKPLTQGQLLEYTWKLWGIAVLRWAMWKVSGIKIEATTGVRIIPPKNRTSKKSAFFSQNRPYLISFLEISIFNIFIGPESDHWECLSLTDSLTD